MTVSTATATGATKRFTCTHLLIASNESNLRFPPSLHYPLDRKSPASP
jgi:hypothetical protein